MNIILIFFILLSAVAVFGWINSALARLILLYYMGMKGYSMPNDTELEIASRGVSDNILKDIKRVFMGD